MVAEESRGTNVRRMAAGKVICFQDFARNRLQL
jgi:hypothetical protein